MKLEAINIFCLPIDKYNLSFYMEAMINETFPDTIADRLSSLYAEKFGGKENGRYRVATKTIRNAVGRRRLYEDDVKILARAMYERGYILIDMDTFFVVMSANSFVNYRRTNEHCFKGMT